MKNFFSKILPAKKPESDSDNYYFRFVSLDLFNWSGIIYKINLSNFNSTDIENKVPKEEYEKVLNHIYGTTKRLRQLATFILYTWLILAFSPLISYLKGTDFTPFIVLSYILMSLLIILPVVFYYTVYGQRENLAVKIKLALDEVNDREYNHKGINWCLTEDGRYMCLQMNFAHYRQKKLSNTSQSMQQSKMIQYKTPSFIKTGDIEVPEIFSESEQATLELISGKRSRTLTTPLIKA